MIVIRELAEIFAIHEIDSEVLAASIRNPVHMTQAALAGAHIATLPFKVLQQMVHHPLTDKGIVQFKADWEAAGRRSPGRREGSERQACQRSRAHDAPDLQGGVELDEVGALTDGDPAAVRDAEHRQGVAAGRRGGGREVDA